ncbi:D-alanyl-D-alanine carboxypeptidase [Myxococcus hansupus]|uniref:D-alanyl-D-alanine carboxypeptidase n=1 Tax=Pseudomyxococcus hansupus TaxID=1297742 RepID=A0A0H4X411_9BACT|nr:serine hydrolase domain-containing protein [Myxococcus hansupus]AKQ68380.1 D-alanyl-D-alanine carboxypeptidase [Myxococcus hansupus]
MRLSRSLLLLLAFAVPWIPRGAGAQSPRASQASRHARVDALFAPWKGKGTPGCAVGISRDGAVDYVRGYGMSNLEHDVPITPQSIFPVASITKQFTAFAIRLLEQDGKLSLDDDIRKYVPEMPAGGKTITLSHLMHHTSGLREQGQLLNLAGWRGDDQYTEEDILWALTRQRGSNFEPGAEVLYGNAPYSLLAIIVRRVSGKPLREFAAERMFKPLGMTDTFFLGDHTEVVPRRVSGYGPRPDGGWRISGAHVDHYGSTSLHSTVVDLLKWNQNLLDARVGGKALIALVRTSGTLKDGTVTGYGSGVFVGTYRGLRVVRHDGMEGGYRSEAMLFPDQRFAVAALCNGAPIDPTELVRKVAEVYLGDVMKDALPPAVALPAAALDALAGTYWSPLTDEVVRLEVKAGALRQVGMPKDFIHMGDGAFRPGESLHVWRFSPPAANAPRALSIQDAWPTSRGFIQVSEPLPTASALAAYTGRYRSDEVDMTYTVRIVDGKLAIRWPRRDEVVLDAIGGDRFVGSLGTVTFTRAASGGLEGLTFSNRRLRRLRAERVEVSLRPQ